MSNEKNIVNIFRKILTHPEKILKLLVRITPTLDGNELICTDRVVLEF